MRYKVFTGSGYIIAVSGSFWGFAQEWGDEWKVVVWDGECTDLVLVRWGRDRSEALSECLSLVAELSKRAA